MARKKNVDNTHLPNPKINPYHGQTLPKGVDPTKGMSLQALSALGKGNIDDFRKFLESGLGGSGYGSSTSPGALPSGTDIDRLLGDKSYWSQLLGMLGNNADMSPYLQMLLGIGADNIGKIGTYPEDVRQKLVELFLNNLVSQEQRQYDKSVVDEQRIYDSPQNQLARLMGAGISRDAALQLLNPSDQSPLVGSGSGVDAGSMTPPSQQVMQAFNTAAGVLGAIGSLVSLGFSIPQALQQIHFMRNQNMLSDRQLKAYDAASRAFSILNNAGAAAESFGSAGAAIKKISTLAADGNTDAQNFISQGGIKQLQDSAPFSSSTLNQLYMSERASGDYAKQFKKEMKSLDLRNQLTQANVQEVYQSIQNEIAQLRKTNVEVDKLFQDIQRQDIEISILGETYRVAAYQGHQADFYDKSLSKLEDLSTKLTPGGADFDYADFMAFNQFADLWEQFELRAVNYDDKEGFVNYVKNNADAARSIALIKAMVEKNLVNALDPGNDNPSFGSAIYRFYLMLRNSGVVDDVNATAKTVSSFL